MANFERAAELDFKVWVPAAALKIPRGNTKVEYSSRLGTHWAVLAHDSSTVETHRRQKTTSFGRSTLTNCVTVAHDETATEPERESDESRCAEFTELSNGDFQKSQSHRHNHKRGCRVS